MATFWQGKMMRKLKATSGGPALFAVTTGEEHTGFLHLGLKALLLCFWQRGREGGDPNCWSSSVLPLSPALTTLPPSPSFPSVSSFCLPNSRRKGKTEKVLLRIMQFISKLENYPFLPEKAERLREANLCLCVSQALCSWIPARISCCFSSELSLKKKKHSIFFFFGLVSSSFTWTCQVLWHLMLNNATFIILLWVCCTL